MQSHRLLTIPLATGIAASLALLSASSLASECATELQTLNAAIASASGVPDYTVQEVTQMRDWAKAACDAGNESQALNAITAAKELLASQQS